MVAFTIFGFEVYWYGIFYLVSFLIGYFLLGLVIKNIKKSLFPKVYDLLNNKKDDFFLCMILGVILGGRLGHFLIYYPFDLFSNPISFFQFNQGGMSFIGGIIGVVVSLFVFFKKNKLTKLEIWQVIDVTVSLVPIGSLIGRWGNYLNQELYGIPVSSSFLSNLSTSKISFLHNINVLHIYDKVDDVLRINTNFLASLGEGLFVLVLVQIVFWKIYRRGSDLPHPRLIGLVSFIWLFAYSIIRFFLEYWRQDSQLEFFGRFTKSQRFFFFFMFFCSFFVIKKILLTYNKSISRNK